MLVYLQIIAITIFTVVGDAFLNKANKHTSIFLNRDFLFGLFVYVSTAFLWVYIYKSVKFSISGVVYSLLTMMLFAAFGVFMFHESLSKTEVLGIGLGIISLCLLGRFL